MKRYLIVALVIAVSLVLSVQYAFAGGWSAVSVVNLPRAMQAAETVELHYRVLQHGVRSVPDLDTYIEAQHVETGEQLTFMGSYDAQAEYYFAALNLPQAGEWSWWIIAFEGPHAMPALNVSAKPEMAAVESQTWWRVWIESFLGTSSTVEPAPVADDMFPTEEDYGAALFVAKGCSSCHVHSENPYAVPEDSYGYLGAYQTGPNLTDFASSAEYLALWLSDPASVRPEALMPNLELSKGEIEALIAFLNSD